MWQIYWWVVLGKDILGGLERPLSPSLGWERQTQCWCNGFSVPAVAWCGWSTLAVPGWRRNVAIDWPVFFLRPESNRAPWDVVNALSIARSLQRPSRWWVMPLPGSNRSLEKWKSSLNPTISTAVVYGWCMLPSLLNVIKWMSNMVIGWLLLLLILSIFDQCCLNTQSNERQRWAAPATALPDTRGWPKPHTDFPDLHKLGRVNFFTCLGTD